MDILSASKAAQLDWLLKQFPKEDIDDLTVRAYEQPLGFFVVFDDGRLQDVLAYPDAYDLGWLLQDRLSISDQRAEAINAGAALSDAELDALKAELMDRQLQSDDGHPRKCSPSGTLPDSGRERIGQIGTGACHAVAQRQNRRGARFSDHARLHDERPGGGAWRGQRHGPARALASLVPKPSRPRPRYRPPPAGDGRGLHRTRPHRSGRRR